MASCKLFDMGYKEVINLADGGRLGYVNDAEIDLETGKVIAFIIPGRRRFFGLLGREEDIIIEWEYVETVGEDLVLIRKEPGGIRRLPPSRH